MKSGNPELAIYHLSTRYTSKSRGATAVAKFEYICRQGRYANPERHESAVHIESGNLPSWASSAAEYWSAADTNERNNGKTGQEFEIALPVELTLEQNIDLVHQFRDRIAGKSLAYSLAIHPGGGTNPHVHLFVSHREQDGIERGPQVFFKRQNKKDPSAGGAPKRSWRKGDVHETRELWAKLANEHLSRAGYSARIDHRSNEQRGLTAVPQIHRGPAGGRRRKRYAERLRRAAEIDAVNEQIARIEREIVTLKRPPASVPPAAHQRKTVRDMSVSTHALLIEEESSSYASFAAAGEPHPKMLDQQALLKLLQPLGNVKKQESGITVTSRTTTGFHFRFEVQLAGGSPIISFTHAPRDPKTIAQAAVVLADAAEKLGWKSATLTGFWSRNSAKDPLANAYWLELKKRDISPDWTPDQKTLSAWQTFAASEASHDNDFSPAP